MNAETDRKANDYLIEALKAHAKQIAPEEWALGAGIVAALGVTGADFARSALGGVMGVMVAQRVRKYLDERKTQPG